MGAHRSIAGVQEEGSSALANLASNHAENQTAIARAGGIEAVVAGMGAHSERRRRRGAWRSRSLKSRRDKDRRR
ncbi:hypothetical protein T484DRAFT_1975028 [Baffinella frigidus]|nr:hypothetical protein T484DRAFT_1975028 [Cryptophyta sp. CCMP2293]